MSAVLGMLAVLLLGYVSDRLLVFADIRRELHEISEQLTRPAVLRKFSDVWSFDSFARNASDVYIVGLTKAGSLTEGPERLANLVRSGCRVRIAVMDLRVAELAQSTAASTTHTAERLVADFNVFMSTMRSVRGLLSARENQRLEIRAYRVIPTMAGMFVKRGSERSAIVYFYPYKTDPSDRPSIALEEGTGKEWLDFFFERADRLWRDVQPLNDPSR
ncbi:hypothetical protein GFY24_11925 [Nocardia sp. SYP-A9097]|uniref:hypothetical protein n=1 Tax=Nocardia sp. SYP-A9097 TaxID=2663237 RepID=UPI00129B8264|nr:hypothetical protein [Nocardia sp. SYP-A9097]MRH88142.1 hypothetical protein [Nocardia sp. SYP-A9097]